MRRTAVPLTVGFISSLLVFLGSTGPAQAEAADTYSEPLQTAIGDLPVAAEDRTGYDRDKFHLWIDADGDGCDTRDEVLISEADDPVTVGDDCELSGGRWFSYYDRVNVTDSSDVDIDHLVPLAEAWDSGASDWTSGQRETYANDLGDYRDLVGVSQHSNRSKGARDPSEWMPTYYKCRYLEQWVAVKIRWRLSIDSTEKAALRSLTSDCDNDTITVDRAI